MSVLVFRSRELMSYSEPISADSFVRRNVYFSLQFADPKLCIPILAPVIYIGKDLEDGDSDIFYFQDYESYTAGVRYSGLTEGSVFHIYGRTEMNHIFEYEKALESLMKCSLRRREK
jgi:hypothetical protein